MRVSTDMYDDIENTAHTAELVFKPHLDGFKMTGPVQSVSDESKRVFVLEGAINGCVQNGEVFNARIRDFDTLADLFPCFGHAVRWAYTVIHDDGTVSKDYIRRGWTREEDVDWNYLEGFVMMCGLPARTCERERESNGTDEGVY